MPKLQFRSVDLPKSVTGRLFLHSMPGMRESFSEFVLIAQKENIQKIVSLTGMDEINFYSPEYAEFIESSSRPSVKIFSIPDFGVPDTLDSFINLIRIYCDFLKKGENILVHCRMGIGRTGIFAVALLIAIGFTQYEAESIIRKAGAGPQTREQRALLSQVESYFFNL